LGPLASACEIEDVDLVLVLDGPDAEHTTRLRPKVKTRRLGSGHNDCEAVEVIADGERWIPLIADQPLRVSNIDKEFFPDGKTKGDLIEYYARIADKLLPHLAGRPISMSRYPNGIGGASFYEKRSPGHQPDWMQTAEVDSESMGGVIDFLLAADRESLMWFANMGCIEIHPFHSRATDLEHPDYAIFDLDPADGSTWDQVVTATTMVKTMLDALGLTGYPKLSGSKGMHVYVPLEPGQQDYARARRFVAAVGELMAQANPSDVTVDWKIPNRKGKVFVDANRNAAGQTIASVYSVRPRAGAPVSIPITWDEVATLKNGDVHLGNIASRVSDVGDLFAPVAEGGQTLDAAEERLEIG
jgi:bifunctional non-homologous end joining protein LigD